jgi:tRNA(Ile)-lysidine synthase
MLEPSHVGCYARVDCWRRFGRANLFPRIAPRPRFTIWAMTNLVEQVETFIRENKLLRAREKALVAVSGGMDSMVLLSILHELASRFHWRLCVAHFNHRLRGRSGERDEQLVRESAARLKLPLFAGAGEVRAFAEQEKISIEMAARRLRHEFLARTARENRLRSLAFGHHAGDQVELFFLRLFRGAGGEGLGGMKASSVSPADRGLRIIRPLLAATREEIRTFASERGVPFHEDETNLSLDFLRNRVRRELLPALRRDYQPALDRTVLRAMEIAGEEARFVREQAARWLERKGKTRFARLPIAVQRSAIQLQLAAYDVPPEFDLIESLRLSPGKRIMIGPGRCVFRDRSGRVEAGEVSSKDFRRDHLPCALTGEYGVLEFGGLEIRWEIQPHRKGKIPRERNCEFFDADKVGASLVLRHWKPGDRFRPIGMERETKLQDFFVNLKIPASERRRLVLAETSDGKVFWVEKLRISEDYKLGPMTVRRLKWRWTPAKVSANSA